MVIQASSRDLEAGDAIHADEWWPGIHLRSVFLYVFRKMTAVGLLLS